MTPIQAAIQTYKKQKYEKQQMKRLLKTRIDYEAIQYFIDLAYDKDVIIDITLPDSTKLSIHRQKKVSKPPVFTGD